MRTSEIPKLILKIKWALEIDEKIDISFSVFNFNKSIWTFRLKFEPLVLIYGMNNLNNEFLYNVTLSDFVLKKDLSKIHDTR